MELLFYVFIRLCHGYFLSLPFPRESRLVMLEVALNSIDVDLTWDSPLLARAAALVSSTAEDLMLVPTSTPLTV